MASADDVDGGGLEEAWGVVDVKRVASAADFGIVKDELELNEMN